VFNEFMDVEEASVWTVREGKSYLEEYLTKRWSGKSIQDLMNSKDNRTEIIVNLKTNTQLSVREIAGLLGINRGTVQKAKENR
jgi:putative transposase